MMDAPSTKWRPANRKQSAAIPKIIEEIDRQQSEAIRKKLSDGNLRAIEIWFCDLVSKRYKSTFPPPWTDKDRRMCKDLLEKYGRERALSLMDWSVSNWHRLFRYPYLAKNIPPRPLFKALYRFRDEIHSIMEEELSAKKKERAALPSPPMDKARPKKSLMEMFLEVKKHGRAPSRD